jgi:hypothetical protein
MSTRNAFTRKSNPHRSRESRRSNKKTATMVCVEAGCDEAETKGRCSVSGCSSGDKTCAWHSKENTCNECEKIVCDDHAMSCARCASEHLDDAAVFCGGCSSLSICNGCNEDCCKEHTGPKCEHCGAIHCESCDDDGYVIQCVGCDIACCDDCSSDKSGGCMNCEMSFCLDCLEEAGCGCSCSFCSSCLDGVRDECPRCSGRAVFCRVCDTGNEEGRDPLCPTCLAADDGDTSDQPPSDSGSERNGNRDHGEKRRRDKADDASANREPAKKPTVE